MNYAPDELAAAVGEAHRAGVKVAAHIYSDEAARMAVTAGVDSVADITAVAGACRS